MTFTDLQESEMDEELAGQPPEEESSNRTFVIAVAVLGGLFLLGLVCIAIYALVIYPGVKKGQMSAAATLAAQATEVSFATTQTAIVAAYTPTPKPTKTLFPTVTPTNTPVIVEQEPSATPLGGGQADAEATRSALLTQVAEAQQTVIATSTLLPQGGIADELGAPGLLALGVALVIVIFLVRRLRTA